MRIVAISGIWTAGYKERMWDHIQAACAEHFPEATFVSENMFYHPWDASIMRNFADEIVARNDRGEDVLLIGHSMGGIIATAIASRFSASRILGIVTIFSPHQHLWGLFPRMLEVEELDGIPLITFGGYLDHMVPYGCSRHDRSLVHENLWSDHLIRLLVSPHIAQHIVQRVQNALGPD